MTASGTNAGVKQPTAWGTYHPWQYKRRDGKFCSKCSGKLNRKGQRYCLKCHAAYMRRWRPKHSDLPKIQREKANARAYANVYQRRGILKPKACERCGEKRAQKHHDDYSKPLQVRWMCRRCHLALHRQQEASNDAHPLRKAA